MTYANASKYGPQDLRKWNPATQQLTMPTVVWVYLTGTTTPATLYTDRTRAVPAANPVTTGVPSNSAGLDGNGNLICYAEAGEYDLLIDGTTLTVSFLPLDSDVQASFSPVWS